MLQPSALRAIAPVPGPTADARPIWTKGEPLAHRKHAHDANAPMSNERANAGASAAQMNEIGRPASPAADLLDKEEFDARPPRPHVLLGARLSVLSKCALLRGRAILGPPMKRLEDEDQKDSTETEFREAWAVPARF